MPGTEPLKVKFQGVSPRFVFFLQGVEGEWVVKRQGWKNNLGSHCGGVLIGFHLIGHEEPSEIFE